MHHFSTIADYCQHISVPRPRHDEFLARHFETDMPTVRQEVEPFRHEFYAVGLLLEGDADRWHGYNDLKANLIFNSPYQIISWNIKPNWKGMYFIISHDYLSQCHFGANLMQDFPFLKLDTIAPFTVPQHKVEKLGRLFEMLVEEYGQDKPLKFKIIENIVALILLNIQRFVTTNTDSFFATEQNRHTDIKLTARYQALVESHLSRNDINPEFFSTSYYAEQLNIHPNHLNSIIKRISGVTAKQVIQDKIILAAKSLLVQSDLSIKEIAYRLGFEEPTNFGSFFKKHTGVTPAGWRSQKE